MMTEWQLDWDGAPGDDRGIDRSSGVATASGVTEDDDRRSGSTWHALELTDDGWLANEEELDRAEWFNEPWE